jgi:nucleotide-binding universal stress UspA family protein
MRKEPIAAVKTFNRDSRNCPLVLQVEIVGQIHYGDPRDKVVEACQQVAADLLVMGSRGLGTVKR